MAINTTRAIDLDSDLPGDMGDWKHYTEYEWKEHLPRPLPAKPGERRKALAGTRIMVGSEVTRQNGEKPDRRKAEDLVAANASWPSKRGSGMRWNST